MKDCPLHPFERNRYFYGKLLTVRDFETEQRYFMGKDRIINRLIHGVGIVCGLDVEDPQIEEGKLTVIIGEGAALDCCGNEIINSRSSRVTVKGSYQDGTNYIYLKYAEVEKEPVPCLANAPACEETCCNSRIQEVFEILVSSEPPAMIQEGDEEDDEDQTECDTSDEHVRPYLTLNDPKVLLAAVNILGNEADIDQDKTREYRSIVYNNPLLSHLLDCLKKRVDNHLNDFENPHNTTAAQVGAPVSIDGVANPGGNIDLIAENSIKITPNDGSNSISIGETHSAVKGNPHDTEHSQTNPLPVDPTSSDSSRNKHVSNADADRWNSSLTGIQVDGGTVLENPGGSVNLAAGANISLTPDETGSMVIISANTGTAPVAAARTGRAVIKTNEKGYGSVTVDSGFNNELFFVNIGVEYLGFVEYGPSIEFAGQVLNPIVRVHRTTIIPTLRPTFEPTLRPTLEPTFRPTFEPTLRPTLEPSVRPGIEDIMRPTIGPLAAAAPGHFDIIINNPELGVQEIPIRWFAVPGLSHVLPTIQPTINPTIIPTINPTINPTIIPTIIPTINPTIIPTINPTIIPTFEPTVAPTIGPTILPTVTPTVIPTVDINPTVRPTIVPTINPTVRPTITPTAGPITDITIRPLNEVSGIGEIYSSRLKENGIASLDSLASAEPARVAEILEVSEVRAMAFVDEARRLVGR